MASPVRDGVQRLGDSAETTPNPSNVAALPMGSNVMEPQGVTPTPTSAATSSESALGDVVMAPPCPSGQENPMGVVKRVRTPPSSSTESGIGGKYQHVDTRNSPPLLLLQQLDPTWQI